MASLTDNPYKRMKKALKGAKADGMKAHEMSKRSVKQKNWIAGAIKKPGALHKELGIKKGNKIPSKTLASAATKGGKLGRRARLAETLKGLKHKKSGRKEPTINAGKEGDVERKSAKKRKSTIGFEDVEQKKSKKKKSAMHKCKGAMCKNAAHKGKE